MIFRKARDRVKQQIAQDRLEMKKKFDKTKAAEAALLMAKVEKAQSLKEKVEKEKLDPYQNIRLQVRLNCLLHQYFHHFFIHRFDYLMVVDLC